MTRQTTWRDRVPLGLSIAACAVSVLGLTPIGHAATALLDRVDFARDTRAVNGIRASRTPRPSRLLPLGPDVRFPASVVPELPGQRGPQGAAGEPGSIGPAGPDGGWAIVVHRDDPLDVPLDGTAVAALRFADLEAGAFLLTGSVALSSAQAIAAHVRCSFVRGAAELGSGAASLGIGPGGARIATLALVATTQAAEPGTIELRCRTTQPGAAVDIDGAQASALRVTSVTSVEVTQ